VRAWRSCRSWGRSSRRCDIKNFTRGSRVFYPVHVPGALFSGGDLHFSQGDGEITFCGAIEMGGFIDFHIDLIKGGMETYGVTTNPILMPGNVEPRYSEFLTFIGIGVDHSTDTQLYNDATMAYRNACLTAIAYLEKFGYSGAQAYLLLGAAPIEGRVSGVVDIPNACCSLYLPTAIFDFDVDDHWSETGRSRKLRRIVLKRQAGCRAHRAVAGAAA
jgi:formamidase